ncbi:MAG: co-chaperone GroES [Candidatus Omnitrophota bacterium]|nr:MAG: co-chaperone GroES [Candidatus Omnitrophota bacterium]RKY44241.1 MAG: co-chaperone GroES [Candidatus Omnitrophota bacterium]HDN85827.1 co-chaperone GroES [Candidatus Omnitrophota bacterium]
MRKIQPINNYVVIKLPEAAEEKTPAGIVIPETAREKPKEGEVVGVSAGATEQLSIGDKVIYKDFSGTQVTFEGEKYLIIPVDDILAKIVEVDSI